MQILELLNLLFNEEKVATEYSMLDPRYVNSYNGLISTFSVRTFHNMMPMVLDVLEKMKTEFYVEKSVCLSNGNHYSD